MGTVRSVSALYGTRYGPVAPPETTKDADPMSQLLAIIDEYKDTHGAPSDSSIARALGVAPQTVSSWRKRGIKNLPNAETLRKLAVLVGKDYETVVLRAALLDVGWVEDEPRGEHRQSS
jgi:transcriptional regulator with XRE-family HTH domain